MRKPRHSRERELVKLVLGKSKKKEEKKVVNPVIVEWQIPFTGTTGVKNRFTDMTVRVTSEDRENVKFIYHYNDDHGRTGPNYSFNIANKDLKPIISELLLYFEGLHTFLGRPESDE